MNEIKIPTNQIGVLRYNDENHNPMYLITSNKQGTTYTLYQILKDNSLKKLKTSTKPTFKECGYN